MHNTTTYTTPPRIRALALHLKDCLVFRALPTWSYFYSTLYTRTLSVPVIIIIIILAIMQKLPGKKITRSKKRKKTTKRK